MMDIELVIKIDEKLYNDIYSNAEIMIYGGMRSGKTLLATLLRAIRNGTPLSENHGKIVDSKEVYKIARKRFSHINIYDGLCRGAVATALRYTTAIVEADE